MDEEAGFQQLHGYQSRCPSINFNLDFLTIIATWQGLRDVNLLRISIVIIGFHSSILPLKDNPVSTIKTARFIYKFYGFSSSAEDECTSKRGSFKWLFHSCLHVLNLWFLDLFVWPVRFVHRDSLVAWIFALSGWLVIRELWKSMTLLVKYLDPCLETRHYFSIFFDFKFFSISNLLPRSGLFESLIN